MNPFEVLCIQDAPKLKDGWMPPVAPWLIKAGEKYIVITEQERIFRGKMYLFYELSIQKGVGYLSEFFVRTSDKDEKDIRRNRAVDKWLNEMITVK